ncbi:hypothetical protein [Aquisphaera insulae]|uniref:hypothetical protein n=1 Tax=Aquisphaera insulae TaxID=2712864 RepID=UPI0013EBCB22|nr:hypothetical protein [Aquisphaera insulae]
MSVLGYPRLHFKGACLIDPATGNNDDVQNNIDAVNVKLLPPLSQMDHDHGRAWMTEGVQATNPLDNQVHWYIKSGWNYFGGLTIEFKDAAITAATGLNGRTTTDDPLVGARVRILGSSGTPSARICDLDPTGSALCQIFAGEISVGGGDLQLRGLQDVRAYSRWVLYRNAGVYQGEHGFVGCGATWQLSIDRNNLEFRGGNRSPLLAELAAAVESSRGVTLQFSVFFPEPSITDEDLIAQYQKNKFPNNPALSLMVGTIGVWEDGELATAPGGRLLLRSTDNGLGPAIAHVHADRHVVSLNLISCFPEKDFSRPPTKADYGEVRLALVPSSGGDPVPISTPIPYDYPTYEATGGIVDLPYDPAVASPDDLNRGTLVLLDDGNTSGRLAILMGEASNGVTVDTDDRGIYLDVGDRADVSILVRKRGGLPDDDVTVWIWEYQYVVDPDGFQKLASASLKLVGLEPHLTNRLEFPATIVFPRGRTTPLPIPIKAIRPGPLALAFTLDGKALEDGYPWDIAAYAGVRVMPDDDFSSVPKDVRTSWSFQYDTIWKFYDLLFPIMSNFIQLHRQDEMEAAAPNLVDQSDPKRWSTTGYMPPTRDLSTGKRALLVEWANELAKGARHL